MYWWNVSALLWFALWPGRALLSAVHIQVDVHTSTYLYKQVHTVFIAVFTEMYHFYTSLYPAQYVLCRYFDVLICIVL